MDLIPRILFLLTIYSLVGVCLSCKHSSRSDAKAALSQSDYLKLVSLVSARQWREPLKGTISSPYGLRNGRMHHGVDIKANLGTPIRAVSRGRVIFASQKTGFGKLVIVEHEGLHSYYAHCQSFAVSKGDWVEAGRLLGYVGLSGKTTGAHLHFELRMGQVVSIDPSFIFKKNSLSVVDPY